MKRREFITDLALTLVGYNFLTACTGSSSSKQNTPANESFELNEATIAALQQQMKIGKTTSEDITKLYLKRINEIDKKGPSVNAVIEINPDAEKIAAALDDERKAGRVRGPLHGIPVLIKDNIDTADRMMTTAGALALMNNKAKKDAFIVKQLREAGAVILGKTNLSEWANFRSARSVSGWSSRGGQTRNPYVLDRSPCGSSSGSAVAVAANLCAVSVGTETDGSISCPASMNSVVGIKPTVGLVSRAGIIPISKTQDTAGPFARTVQDAAILLGILAGVDINDAITMESKGKGMQDYTKFLDVNGLAGKRIGVEKKFLKGHEAIDALLKKALDQMKGKGAVIVEVDFMKEFKKAETNELLVLEYEFKDGVNKYLSTANARVKSLQDVIDYNRQNEAKAMPYFKQELLDSSQAKGSLQDKEYIAAITKYADARKAYNKFFDDNQLDALCGPANGFPWCIDFMNGDFFTGYGAYGPAAVCGYPSITIPMGNVNELPVGISFLGKAYTEPQLISIGYAYEQASKNRVVPKFRKTLL